MVVMLLLLLLLLFQLNRSWMLLLLFLLLFKNNLSSTLLKRIGVNRIGGIKVLGDVIKIGPFIQIEVRIMPYFALMAWGLSRVSGDGGRSTW